MATFTIAFDGTRVNDAQATTGWTSDTATVGTEADFFYQNTLSISATVKTTENGFYYTSTSQNMSTGAGGVALLKILATNKDVLDGNGVVIRIGSGTGAYYQYNNVFTATTYPIAGGWQIVGINPNVSGWRSSTTGSPNLAAVTYWAFRADFSATSKSQNLAVDAIDWVTLGTGLTCTRGDGADPDGTFALILAADEGTAVNRWGVITSRDGIFYVNAVLTIGASGTATSFTDSNQIVVFRDHRTTTGSCGIDFNIQNASTVISTTSCFFSGRGTLTGSDDTRPDYTIVGTSGTLTVTGSTFSVFRQIDWNNKVTAQDTTYVNGLLVVGAGADLVGSEFSGCTGAADASYLSWDVATDPDGLLDDCTFTKGTTATHAISFGTTSPTTMTLRGIAFSGYNAANAANDSTLYFARTTGTVTVSLVGCSGNISYKSAGATIVLVVDPVTTAVTVRDINTNALIQNARVLLRAADGTGPLPYLKSTTITRSGSTATATATAHGLLTNDYAVITGANQPEYNGVFQVTKLTDDTFSYTVTGTPTTPATGTITTTGVALYGLTNGSGFLSASRSYSSPQPIAGTVRRATVADGTLYRPQPVSGTVSNTAGFSATVQLIRDE